MTRIYSRTGDRGETGLFGGGRVSKASLRIEACGAVDELNSTLGSTIAQNPGEEIAQGLTVVQSDLFTIGAHLAAPARTRGRKPDIPALDPERVTQLERWIDAVTAELPELRSFILPGGSPAGAALHLARTVCRRAERRVVALAESEKIDDGIVIYLNRLSDLLFVLARGANRRDGRIETPWPATP